MKKVVTVLMVLGLFASVSFGQEQAKYGLGFEFHTDPNLAYSGLLGIYVPIETGSLFIEPLIMYSSSSEEVDYNDYTIDDSEYKESNLTLLIGIFKPRSEEHTSELQSRRNLVCRLLLEKKKNN